MRVCMLDRVGAFKRGGHARNSLVDLAENPEYPRRERLHGDAGVLARGPGGQSVGLLACAEQLDGAFEFLSGLHDASHEHENHRPPADHIEQCPSIAARFGAARHALHGFERLRQLAPHDVHGREPESHLKILGRFSESLA